VLPGQAGAEEPGLLLQSIPWSHCRWNSHSSPWMSTAYRLQGGDPVISVTGHLLEKSKE